MNQEIITNNFAETQKLAKEFARRLHAGDVIVLYGDLGAGKTTFVQGLAKALGIEKRIISPTFVILRSYELEIMNPSMDESNIRYFYHVDLYRLSGEADIEGTGLLEVLKDGNAITVIEWPEKMGNLLPENRWEIHFEHVKDDKRKITIEKINV